MTVDPERVAKRNAAPEHPNRRYVLYWMQMNRRVDSNHALLFAIERANELNLPVLVYEPLTYTGPYANDRLYSFVLQAVPETGRRLERLGIGYVFYLRKTRGGDNALLELAKEAAAVVTDEYPVFQARLHNEAFSKQLDSAFYAVDSSCVVPMGCIATRQFGAYTIRPRIHKLLPRFLRPAPKPRVKRPFSFPVPHFHTTVEKANMPDLIASCEINHSIAPSVTFTGGRKQAERLLRHFLHYNLRRFDASRNEPSEHATSHMSPYLHFGQISPLEIALAVKDYADQHKLLPAGYLEELIVRRELAFNYCRFVEDPASLANLPAWCQETMRAHAGDKRDPSYTPEQFTAAATHDELWNATQREMLLRGKIHGYYRMYWGKKIIEWSPTYEEAARTMIDIHGHYALDGRDPNTFTNVLWCFGLHDRAWAERPVFGKIRYMSLEGMRRKTETQAYIDEINRLWEASLTQ